MLGNRLERAAPRRIRFQSDPISFVAAETSLDDGQRASTAADTHTYSNRVPVQQFSENHWKTNGYVEMRSQIGNEMIPHSCRLGRHKLKKQASNQSA
jgi:hypothetical protein